MAGGGDDDDDNGAVVVVEVDEDPALNFWHYWNDWAVSTWKRCCYDSVEVMPMILVVVAETW